MNQDLMLLLLKILGYATHEDIPRRFGLLVTGQREFTDGAPVESLISDLRTLLGNGIQLQLIHGACRGADTIAAELAKPVLGESNVLSFPASWQAFGKAAGVMRNIQMANLEPNLTAAFYNSGGPAASRGTNDMVKRIWQKKLKLIKYEVGIGWTDGEEMRLAV